MPGMKPGAQRRLAVGHAEEGFAAILEEARLVVSAEQRVMNHFQTGL
jgi:hypothetical protein